MEIENQRDYFSLLIPAYLRGGLDSEEVAELEAAAKLDPEIAADIELQRNLKEIITLSEEKPAKDGWDKLQAAMGADVPLQQKSTPSLALVAFKETALLSDMTDILAETGGKIINGPSALGLYSVTFETSEACLSAHAKLSSQDIPLDVETLSDCD